MPAPRETLPAPSGQCCHSAATNGDCVCGRSPEKGFLPPHCGRNGWRHSSLESGCWLRGARGWAGRSEGPRAPAAMGTGGAWCRQLARGRMAKDARQVAGGGTGGGQAPGGAPRQDTTGFESVHRQDLDPAAHLAGGLTPSGSKQQHLHLREARGQAVPAARGLRVSSIIQDNQSQCPGASWIPGGCSGHCSHCSTTQGRLCLGSSCSGQKARTPAWMSSLTATGPAHLGVLPGRSHAS